MSDPQHPDSTSEPNLDRCCAGVDAVMQKFIDSLPPEDRELSEKSYRSWPAERKKRLWDLWHRERPRPAQPPAGSSIVVVAKFGELPKLGPDNVGVTLIVLELGQEFRWNGLFWEYFFPIKIAFFSPSELLSSRTDGSRIHARLCSPQSEAVN